MENKNLSDLLVSQKENPGESSGALTRPSGEEGDSSLPLILSILALVLGAVLTYTIWQQGEQLKGIEAHGQKLDQAVELINKGLDESKKQLASLESQGNSILSQLGSAQQEREEGREATAKLTRDHRRSVRSQKRNVESITKELKSKAATKKVVALEEESGQRFDGVDEEITIVKEDVKSTRKDLLDTMAELSNLGVKVNKHGQMIATNGSGVAELRKRGERDYVEFSLKKKRKTRVTQISLELRKTRGGDHPNVDLRIYANDSKIERKGVSLNTPVNFYVGSQRIAYELVVNEILKNSCAGYISAPKGTLAQGGPALSAVRGD